MLNQEFNRESAAATSASGASLFGQMCETPALRYDGALRQCAWCRRIPVGQDVWMEVEEAIQTLPFISLKMVNEASHGICPECYDSFLSEKQTARIG
jgi:hypothetical protein